MIKQARNCDILHSNLVPKQRTIKLLPELNRMKKKLFIYLLALSICILSVSSIIAQPIAAKKITDRSQTMMLNSIKTFHQFSGKDLGITLLEVTNPAGSAKVLETEEVTSHLYLGVTEPDLKPRQALYVIKDLYAPSNFTLVKSEPGAVWISFDYISRENKQEGKKKVTVKLTLENAAVVK